MSLNYEKNKIVWCDFCREEHKVSIVMNTCPNCGHRVITAVFSALTGERITANGQTHWLDASPDPISKRGRQSGDFNTSTTDKEDGSLNGRRL